MHSHGAGQEMQGVAGCVGRLELTPRRDAAHAASSVLRHINKTCLPLRVASFHPPHADASRRARRRERCDRVERGGNVWSRLRQRTVVALYSAVRPQSGGPATARHCRWNCSADMIGQRTIIGRTCLSGLRALGMSSSRSPEDVFVPSSSGLFPRMTFMERSGAALLGLTVLSTPRFNAGPVLRGYRSLFRPVSHGSPSGW
ncbi:hypothetical protein SAMN05443551_2487 [Marivita hallyeonensis]|uniref:Uncharacterized protein n=1 Tax=Marivita hallyeonensis TaxID=996342 RepID=A0A1M5U4Y1_9RHOB|nr:hypothetical protein SAMN05443551_2487 [Marivita hallyeonensis]